MTELKIEKWKTNKQKIKRKDGHIDRGKVWDWLRFPHAHIRNYHGVSLTRAYTTALVVNVACVGIDGTPDHSGRNERDSTVRALFACATSADAMIGCDGPTRFLRSV